MNHESSNRMTIEGVIEIAICEWRLERVEVERNENIRSLKSGGISNAKVLKWKTYLSSSRNSKINMGRVGSRRWSRRSSQSLIFSGLIAIEKCLAFTLNEVRHHWRVSSKTMTRSNLWFEGITLWLYRSTT